jgi:hypothetical protein
MSLCDKDNFCEYAATPMTALMAAAAVADSLRRADTRLRVEMLRIDSERGEDPPLAPLIAPASIPRIQMCILFISVYGRARCKQLRF